MSVYAQLARIFPRSYRAKLMTVVLAGSLVPMLALVLWLMGNNGMPPERLIAGVVVGLGVTVVGTLVSLMLLYKLLSPVRYAVEMLEGYEQGHALPDDPPDASGHDDIARLVRGIHRCLHAVEASRRTLERHALEDSLTRAMNRRGTRRALRASVEAARGTGDPFTLVVVDLDNLKTINDEQGHAAGDFALVSLVESAHECCLGQRDWVGRWGGDEFMLGLHADPGVAVDRVRAWIEVLARPGDGAVAIHVSAGAAVMSTGLDEADLYRRGDAAMYRAKVAGGRRLCVDAAAGDAPANAPRPVPASAA